MSFNYHEIVRKDMEEINAVSPTFCLAKWLQSTIYMWNGFSHSCHHPKAHPVSAEAVKENPKALHNTPIKIVARKDMLKGIQTPECDYCWKIENLGQDHISDRSYKSITSWSKPLLQEVLDSGTGEEINPSYLEVAFENTCNFKCTYCSPDISSRWMEEVQHHGPIEWPNGYKMHNIEYLKDSGKFPIGRHDYNPYIEAFWKWWPELYQKLHTFRITGGEPLLSQHTWKVMDYMIENPRPDLTFAINTNLNVPRKLINKLIEYINKLEGKIKAFMVFTSCEATDEQTEYIRYGMKYQEFCENVDMFLAQTPESVRLNFMVTTNMLCYSTFDKFLDQVVEWRKKYNKDHRHNRVPIMVSYLRWPEFISMQELPAHLKPKFREKIQAALERHRIPAGQHEVQGLYEVERDQLERLLNFMDDRAPSAFHEETRKEYYRVSDQRRSTNFAETFPDLV